MFPLIHSDNEFDGDGDAMRRGNGNSKLGKRQHFHAIFHPFLFFCSSLTR